MRMSVAELAKEQERIAGILDCVFSNCAACKGCPLLLADEKQYLANGYRDFRGYMLAKLKNASKAYDEEYRKEQIWNITTSIATGG